MSPSTTRATPFIVALAAAAALAGGVYGCSKKGQDDRLSDQQAGVTQQSVTNAGTTATVRTAADPAKRCASTATYDLVKRELFRRAAQIRGRDDALLDRIAQSAALRVERPVVTSRDEGLGGIACAASASIDLPPGLAVAGGRTSLSADLGYTLQPAADGSGDVVTFTNADGITIPLATLGRSASAITPPPAPVAATAPPPPVAPVQASPAPAPATGGLAPPPPPPAARRPAAPPPSPAARRPAPPPIARSPLAPRAPSAGPTVAQGASPSFACARARTRGEAAVCGDAALAALDRRMAVQYRSAFAAASPETRDLLRSTAHRFYGFRDNCPTARCIAEGYRQRMAEIDDLMQGDSDR